MDIFGNIGQDVTKAAQGVGNAVGQIGQDVSNFTKPVQQFIGQASQGLAKLPGTIGQDVYQGANQINSALDPRIPNSIWANQSFQRNPVTQTLLGAQKIPQFQLPGIRLGQAVNQDLGGGIPGMVGQTAVDFVPNFLNSVVNAPGQVAQGSIDFAKDVNTNQLTGQHALSDLSETGQGMLTVGTLGEGSLLKGIATDSWKTGLLKGLVNSMPVGAGFGLMQGLQQGRDSSSVGQQFQQSIPYIAGNMLGAGILSTVLGPGGRAFFGNRTPGDAAAMSSEGLVPPETMKDAYSILGVSQNSSLDAIRGAYTQAIQELHPQNGGTDEAFTALNNAYEMATRNTAPSVSFANGAPNIQWTDEFGGNSLTPQQVITARKAAADNTAFQARVENLKGGNVPVKNPNQPDGMVTPQDFLEKGADLISPEGNSQLIAKTRQSAENQPAFQDAISTIAQQLSGRAMSSVKDPEVMASKILGHRNAGEADYGIDDVGDSLRGSIVVNDKSQIPQAVSALQQEIANRGWKVTKTQDFFSHPGETGYEGYHVDVELPDGQKSEIQLHTPESWAAARLTHPAYETYDDNLPDNIQKQVSGIQDTIKTNGHATNQVLAQQDEAAKANKVLSPMSSDYTKTIGQLQQEHQEPDLTAYENAMNSGDKQAMDLLAAKHPDDTRFQIHNRISVGSSPELQNLTKARETLKAQLQPSDTSPELQGMVKMRNNLQTDLNATQSVLKTNPQTPNASALKAHANALQDQIAKIDTTVSDMQGKIKIQNADKISGTKDQLGKLDSQIGDEQKKIQVRQAVEPEKTRLQDTGANPSALPATEIGNSDSYAPSGGFRDNYKFIADNLTGENAKNYGTGRQMARVVRGQAETGVTLGNKLATQIISDLPDPQSRENVQYALGGSTDPSTLTPEEKGVYDQLKGIMSISKDIRSSDPAFQSLETYAPFYAIRPGANATPDIKAMFSNLNDYTHENIHREIRAFDPVSGGKSLIGSAPRLGLKGEGNTFEDMQGNQYLARMAKQKEVEDAGIVDYEKDVAETVRKNVASTVRYKAMNDAINTIKSSQYGRDVSETPFPGAQKVDGVPGLDKLYFTKEMADTINQFQSKPNNDPAVLQWIDKGQNAIRNTVFYNMFTHPLNMFTNAMIGSGRAGVAGPMKFLADLPAAAKDVWTKNQNYIDTQKAGAGLGAFSKGNDEPGMFERMSEKLFHNDAFNKIAGGADTINPVRQFYRLNKGFVGFSDDVLRTALQKTLTNTGVSDVQAANTVNKFLVDYGNTGEFEKNVVNRALIFYPWLKGNMGMLGTMARHPVQNAMPIVTAALMYGGLQEFQNWRAQQTGNPDTRERFPGVLGDMRNIAEAPGQLAQGQIPGLLANHIQPSIRMGAQQIANKAYFPSLFDPNGQPIVKPTDANTSATLGLQGNIGGVPLGISTNQDVMKRLGVTGTVLGPEQTIAAGMQGKKTLGEIAQNYMGETTPHLKGFAAEPNQPNAKFMGLLPINGTQSPTTGMEIIHGQDAALGKLSSTERTQYNMLSQLTAKGDPSSLKQYRDILAGNQNIWDAKAQIEKVNAQAGQRQVDPLYKLDYAQAKNYLNYESMSSADKGAFAENDPSVVDIARQRDAYYQSPDYSKYQQQLAQSIPGYKNTPSIHNPIYDAFPAGQQQYPTAFGTANVDGNQAIADHSYWRSLPSGQPKTAFAANHPWVYQGALAEAPYSEALMQQKWDNRPSGQTTAQFIQANTTTVNGKTITPNFTGVDANGKIIQAYNPVGDPLYQADPKLQSAALAYTAFNEAKNTTAKRAILAQNPDLVGLWNARSAYFAANPSQNPGDTTGIGLDFTSASGSGGSGSSSGYSSSNSLQSTMAYMLKYSMHPAPPAVAKVNLKNPFGQSQQTTAALKANPLKSYYTQEPQQLVKILSSMPKLQGTPNASALPARVKLPKIGAKLNFSENPALPPGTNERVVAGRVPTGASALK